MGELVRRAVSEYRPGAAEDSEAEAALVRLTAELHTSTERAETALVTAERDINEATGMLRKVRAQIRSGARAR
jgi:hypothetical protein